MIINNAIAFTKSLENMDSIAKVAIIIDQGSLLKKSTYCYVSNRYPLIL